jgi:alkylhydroperoxidase family enzyme
MTPPDHAPSSPTPLTDQLAPPGGWRSPGRVRLPPLRADEASMSKRLISAAVVRFGKVNAANLFLMLLRDLGLFRAWLGFARRLMPYGKLDRQDTERVILRVAWNCRCRYEWGQHVDIGLRAGLTADDIRRVAEGPAAFASDRHRQAILLACDEIHRQRMIGEDTWQTLAAQFSETRLLELLMLINHYEMLAGVLNSTGLELDAGLEAILASAAIHHRR